MAQGNEVRTQRSPLLLTRRKAQRLATRIEEEARTVAIDNGLNPEKVRRALPFVQESVFLHAADVGRGDAAEAAHADAARKDPGNDYVLVIDEINRGNPAQIFGEKLTLLEHDKRHPDSALNLAYPREGEGPFHLPENLYVIGTMNLADRSLALVDIALRRGFAFCCTLLCAATSTKN